MSYHLFNSFLFNHNYRLTNKQFYLVEDIFFFNQENQTMSKQSQSKKEKEYEVYIFISISNPSFLRLKQLLLKTKKRRSFWLNGRTMTIDQTVGCRLKTWLIFLYKSK